MWKLCVKPAQSFLFFNGHFEVNGIKTTPTKNLQKMRVCRIYDNSKPKQI